MKCSRRMRLAAATAALVMTLAACGSSTGDGAAGDEQPPADTGAAAPDTGGDNSADDPADQAPADSDTASADSDTAPADSEPRTVTLLTHDSFAVDPAIVDAFTAESGIDLKILAQGDAGELVSKVILTAGNPLGDVVFGIDNTLATKALDVLAPYTSPAASDGSDRMSMGDDRLTAIDFGDVCVNIDHDYFAAHDLTEPVTLEDLAKPEYRDLFVAIDPGTSSPGLAFLFATIAHFGEDGYLDYWQQLRDNGVMITGGWTDAYTVNFSGSSGHGDRPLVVSYASSPPSEVPEGADVAPTGALLDTCFRQVEYAGILDGAADPQAAGEVIDFLLSDTFQAQIPSQMWMYPVDTAVDVPADWAQFAPAADDPATLDPALIDAHRQQWIDDWSDVMHR